MIALKNFITAFAITYASVKQTSYRKKILAKSFRKLCNQLVDTILVYTLCLILYRLFDAQVTLFLHKM